MEEKTNGANPNGGERRRRAQQKLTDAGKAALIEILKRPDVRVDGKIDVTTVAKISGLSYGQVYGFIRSDRYWHAQVGEADVGKLEPTEADQADSEPSVGVTVSNAQFEEYRALIRQNRKMLAQDWKSLGMTEEAGKRMEHYGMIGTAPTSMVLRVMGGQLISNLELLDRVIKADAEMILTGKLPEEAGANGEPKDPEQVEREWRHTLFKGMKLQLEMYGYAHKMQALMARVMSDLRKMNGGQAPAAKGEYDAEAQTTAVSERGP